MAGSYSAGMKAWLLIGLVGVFVLCGFGCRQKAAPVALSQNVLIQQAGEVDGPVLMKLFLDSFEKEVYATNVSARFQTAFNEAIVQKLMAEAPSELKRKLETLERKTNRHPFTEDQLKEALRRKERRN